VHKLKKPDEEKDIILPVALKLNSAYGVILVKIYFADKS
jgi:hypothetical protein